MVGDCECCCCVCDRWFLGCHCEFWFFCGVGIVVGGVDCVCFVVCCMVGDVLIVVEVMRELDCVGVY